MDLTFTPHTRLRMRRRQLPEAAIYHVVRDADEVIERPDGRIEYTGVWEGRVILAIVEGDEEDELRSVVSVMEEETRRRGGQVGDEVGV